MAKNTDKFERIVRFFYKNPNKEIHVRGLAKSLDCSVGFISQNISSLVNDGIVEEDRKGNMKTFTARSTSSEYRKKKRAWNIGEILVSDLPEYLEGELYPDAIILFGSYLEGTDSEDSDIDLAIINGREKSLNLSSYEDKFERDINLTQIDSLNNSEKDFLNTLANGLVLKGYLEVI
ncbi:MAG: nucleotidyltransferase domain-containing protein [Candidatus Aenigmatarchaeota archaeon]